MPKAEKINKTDLKILQVLQTNARITNQQLAEEVHLSASACLSRVKRLEKTGVLKRYLAEIDLEKLAPHIEAFAEITLENHFPEDFGKFEAAIEGVAEVTDCYKISGPYDYLLKFVCPDVRSYNTLSDDLIKRSIGIAKVSTLIILERTKEYSGLPLSALVEE
ncbi:MAG: Lrp/AsnC family transcriptional regulator [Gammaproteobacteria bacterium]|nr:Lrp/AsnC family transcriptional regulator [Gammaproteobacteria bacterium]